jgi:hypothetical protein
MKTTWNGEFLRGMEGLTFEEKTSIIGGESLWYWVVYGVGLEIHMWTHLTPTQSGGQQLMNAALG